MLTLHEGVRTLAGRHPNGIVVLVTHREGLWELQRVLGVPMSSKYSRRFRVWVWHCGCVGVGVGM